MVGAAGGDPDGERKRSKSAALTRLGMRSHLARPPSFPAWLQPGGSEVRDEP